VLGLQCVLESVSAASSAKKESARAPKRLIWSLPLPLETWEQPAVLTAAQKHAHCYSNAPRKGTPSSLLGTFLVTLGTGLGKQKGPVHFHLKGSKKVSALLQGAFAISSPAKKGCYGTFVMQSCLSSYSRWIREKLHSHRGKSMASPAFLLPGVSPGARLFLLGCLVSPRHSSQCR